MATVRKDKILLQRVIRKLQYKLRMTRQKKYGLLRRLKKISDSFSGIERGKMIRRNRLEQYVNYYGKDISKQYHIINRRIYLLKKKYAVSNAMMISEMAAKYTYNKMKLNSKDEAADAEKIKKAVQKKTKIVYEKVYRHIVHLIRSIVVSGWSMKDIEKRVEMAVDRYVSQLKLRMTYLESLYKAEEKTETDVLKTTVKQAVEQQMKKEEQKKVEGIQNQQAKDAKAEDKKLEKEKKDLKKEEKSMEKDKKEIEQGKDKSITKDIVIEKSKDPNNKDPKTKDQNTLVTAKFGKEAAVTGDKAKEVEDLLKKEKEEGKKGNELIKQGEKKEKEAKANKDKDLLANAQELIKKGKELIKKQKEHLKKLLAIKKEAIQKKLKLIKKGINLVKDVIQKKEVRDKIKDTIKKKVNDRLKKILENEKLTIKDIKDQIKMRKEEFKKRLAAAKNLLKNKKLQIQKAKESIKNFIQKKKADLKRKTIPYERCKKWQQSHDQQSKECR